MEQGFKPEINPDLGATPPSILSGPSSQRIFDILGGKIKKRISNLQFPKGMS